MVAGPWLYFGPWLEALHAGDVALSDAHKVYLATSGWTPNRSTDDELSDIGNEASNYTRPAITLAGIRTGVVVGVDGDNQAFIAVGGATVFRYFVIFNDDHADDMPVAYCLADVTPANVTIAEDTGLLLSQAAEGIISFDDA